VVELVELRVRDLFSISLVLGVMVGTMTFFIHMFASGIDVTLLYFSLRLSLTTGGATSVIVLVYTTMRYIERKRKQATQQETVPIEERLRAQLMDVEDDASRLEWAKDSRWTCNSHVRVERGTLTVDLHDLNIPLATTVMKRIMAGREFLGRVRIVTGRGAHSKTIPKLRPLALELFRNAERDLDWQVIQKRAYITLRPLGKAPSVKQWLFRFIVLGGPITVVLAFSFRDLAGEGAYQQGMMVGAGLGVVLSALLSSYRDRA